MNNLDTWLDEECRDMTIALMMRPTGEWPVSGEVKFEATGISGDELERRLADYREALRRSYRGQFIALADELREIWREVPWPLRKPVEWYVRLLDRVTGTSHD